jgi:RNA-binding protein
MNPLPSKKRSELRAAAHKLSPVVIVGDKGLTDEVVAEVERSLKAHELIKVRAATDDRDAREAWLATLCERLQAHAVQQIGKVFVIYRENPKETVEKPRRKLGPGPSPRSGARGDESRKPRSGARGEEVRKPRFGKPADEARKPRFGKPADEARKPRFGKPADEDRKPRFGKTSLDPRKARTAERTEGRGDATGISRPRSRTPSPRPASGPPRRRPRTSR